MTVRAQMSGQVESRLLIVDAAQESASVERRLGRVAGTPADPSICLDRWVE
jgi:hypothetical protein